MISNSVPEQSCCHIQAFWENYHHGVLYHQQNSDRGEAWTQWRTQWNPCWFENWENLDCRMEFEVRKQKGLECERKRLYLWEKRKEKMEVVVQGKKRKSWRGEVRERQERERDTKVFAFLYFLIMIILILLFFYFILCLSNVRWNMKKTPRGNRWTRVSSVSRYLFDDLATRFVWTWSTRDFQGIISVGIRIGIDSGFTYAIGLMWRL